MFDLAILIDALRTETGWEVSWAKETQPDLTAISVLRDAPRISVGALSILPVEEVSYAGTTDPYSSELQEVNFVLSLHIIAHPETLDRHWRRLFNFLLGWSPYPGDEHQYSGLTYVKGDMLGITNGRAWWLDQWKLSFPTVTFNP